MEELTTGMSDLIAVNSGFTAGMFKKSFPSVHQTPQILYPPINFDAYDRPVDRNDPTVKILETYVLDLQFSVIAINNCMDIYAETSGCCYQLTVSSAKRM